jgi:predicted SAM-dependent methyltransferase
MMLTTRKYDVVTADVIHPIYAGSGNLYSAEYFQLVRRVLKPGGVLRLVLPDLDKGIAAYQRRDAEYFKIPDEDARSLGAKFVTQMVWYGYSRSLFTYEFIEEQLQKAGFSRVANCGFKRTMSPYPEIVELDNRERESLFVEAVK